LTESLNYLWQRNKNLCFICDHNNTYEVTAYKNTHRPARLLHSRMSTVYYEDKHKMVQVLQNRYHCHTPNIIRFSARSKTKRFKTTRICFVSLSI